MRRLLDRVGARRCGFAWFASCVLSAPAVGQQIAVSLLDGEIVVGEIEGLAGSGREANLLLAVGEGVRTLPLARVLGLHGPEPAPTAGALAYLVGGDQLRGEVLGGDAAGDKMILRSPSVGEVAIPVDRLAAVVFGSDVDTDRSEFVVPKGADGDEALFRRAKRGYDTTLGAIHRFAPNGVVFEWSGQAQPELVPYRTLAAIGVRGGVPRTGDTNAHLVTRGGDVLHVDLVGASKGQLAFEMEGGRRLELRVPDVAAVTFLGDRVFLSDLEPIRVEERGHELDEASQPLYRFRGDRAVVGGALVVGGRTHGKGLGTHAKCVLTYRVPEGVHTFHAWVGIDDRVCRTAVRGSAEVSVKVNDEVVLGPTVVNSGEPARPVGPIEVAPGALLTLQADFGAGWFFGDRVDWLSPVLER